MESTGDHGGRPPRETGEEEEEGRERIGQPEKNAFLFGETGDEDIFLHQKPVPFESWSGSRALASGRPGSESSSSLGSYVT